MRVTPLGSSCASCARPIDGRSAATYENGKLIRLHPACLSARLKKNKNNSDIRPAPADLTRTPSIPDRSPSAGPAVLTYGHADWTFRNRTKQLASLAFGRRRLRRLAKQGRLSAALWIKLHAVEEEANELGLPLSFRKGRAHA